VRDSERYTYTLKPLQGPWSAINARWQQPVRVALHTGIKPGFLEEDDMSASDRVGLIFAISNFIPACNLHFARGPRPSSRRKLRLAPAAPLESPANPVLPEVFRAFLVDPTSLEDFSISAVVPLRSPLQVQMKGPLVSKHNMSCHLPR
jgi:hypothetical protein